MPPPLSQLPLESIIATTVALDDSLGQGLFSQARHHARVVALHATAAQFDAVAACAQRLMGALNQAARPERQTWAEPLKRLHEAIDRALDVGPSDEA